MSTDKRDTFRRSLRELKNLPTLPGIVAKLTKMAENPDTTTEQMGREISKDQILSAKLLKLVNSAFYGFPHKIGSLNSAIILLGFNVIKSLIISASIFEIMESKDLELWEHSLGCAVVCNVLAKRMGLSDPEEVSTAGLIHDIGKVAIKIELPEEFEQIHRIVEQKKISFLEAEQELLGFNHAEAGGWLTGFWNLPQKLVEPITCHHDPRNASNQMAASIIHFSDIMIRGLGYGHGADKWVPQLNKRAWQILALGPADIDKLLEEIEEKLWDVKGFSLEINTPADSIVS